MKTLFLVLCCLLFAHSAQARPQQRPELTAIEPYVDIVGDVDGNAPIARKAASDTTWIATWDFEGCDDTGWVRSDNRIENDGSIYWAVSTNFDGIGNIVGNAAAVGGHDLCWVFPDGYDNGWYQGIRLQYLGDSYLSFDYLLDSEAGFDFLQVESDSACASFSRVDYNLDPTGNAQSFRNLLWSRSGLDTAAARVDSIALPGYASGDTHCVYIAFLSDGGWSPADGAVPSRLGVGAVIDNVSLEGSISRSEDFNSFTPTPDFSFVNLHDSTPFGTWARTFSHITDNDLCSENLTCAWFATDHTSPTFAVDPSMAFGPSTYVIKNWLDESVVSPWVSLASTPLAHSTLVQFNRFGGNTFNKSRIVQNWSIRGKLRIPNTDTPAPGDSIDCVSGWGHSSTWNSLNKFFWDTITQDATPEFDATTQEIQVRFRQSDWQWYAGAGPPVIFSPGPGPYWDRVRIGRLLLNDPVINPSARYQAQDAAPNDPAHEAGPLYAQASGSDAIFGTVAFSRSQDDGFGGSPNLIVGDSIYVEVQDVLGHGGLVVEVYASIVAGPHSGKAPAPYQVGANGFFVVTADSMRFFGVIVPDFYGIDLDDTYFRGGDVLRYFWWATDQQGGIRSYPTGLTSIPSSLAAAEEATGGLLEVNYLPSINWDPNYLSRIAADAHGDLDPTPTELANSSQANCILYYQVVNSARRSGDVNRTSFMYTLDKLGYKGKYDVYDTMGAGNTNNPLGARMSPAQAANYSLLIYDASFSGGGVISGGKTNMSAWFQSWNALSGAPNAEHTLWIMGMDVMEGNPAEPLFASMAATLASENQAQDSNPDVFGIANFTNHTSCVEEHTADRFALNGGCPFLRDYDDIRPTGTGVLTHVYGKGTPSSAGAIVMNANAEGYSTILQSFAWRDLRSGIGQSPSKADEQLLTAVLGCALPLDCLESVNPTNVSEDDNDQIAVPGHTVLHQNTPNPFNPMTTITFDLARDAHVSLKIYDVAGRLVRDLTNAVMTAGFKRQALWNGMDNEDQRVSSGVYFYKLEAGDFSATRKMLVVK